MKTKLIFIVMLAFFGCKSYEKIGGFEYIITNKRVNTGDFGGIIEDLKCYSNPVNDAFLFGYVVKSQKLHFESKNDTVFSIGRLQYNKKSKTIICTEVFKNGYEQFLKTDSIVRVFTQKENGDIVLKEYLGYQKGKKSELINK